MDLGNWLAPIIVFLVTVTLLRQLFAMMEKLQDELQQEKATTAVLEEREKIAGELHDGIAQSLFLLSVRVDRMKQTSSGEASEAYLNLRKTLHEVNEYVRQAIASLRYPATANTRPWLESLHHLIDEYILDTGMNVHLKWSISEQRLSVKEKVELYASIREALINVYKHAQAATIWILGENDGADGWKCTVSDDGIGFSVRESPPLEHSSGGFGLAIIQDRAAEMKWEFKIFRNNEKTTLELRR
ncbi:histidine kinase [Paenibacillus sp. y28]